MDTATAKWGSSDPNPIDEPTVTVKVSRPVQNSTNQEPAMESCIINLCKLQMYGRNEVPNVEMHGWSHYFPVNFPYLEQARGKSV